MANIKVLDDKTINQIAAGEVVERPVSVVKELVENAIDAKATNISVEIKDGGISLIRVTDNGVGIDRDNIKTAFLRHATSKINSIEDLLSISSLGFRGEALSSIAAVSQIELLTKVSTEIFGIRYCISGGKEQSFDEVGVPDGTTMIVRNLFFNTPARRKFLKSPMTEGNYITELMERLVLSHPEIGFKYIINGKEKIVSSGNNDIKHNIYSIYGRDLAKLIVPINYECDDFTVKGYIGKPETARGNRNFELFFVNSRYVKSSVLSKAVEEAYKEYLMLHKYPVTMLYFDIPSADLDVNVHPAKTEIRFLKEQVLYSSLVTVINDALKGKELIPEVLATKPDNDKQYEPIIEALSEHVSEPINEPVSVPTPMAESLSSSKSEPVRSNLKSFTPEPFQKREISEYKEKEREIIAKDPVISDVKQETLFEEAFLNEKSVLQHKIIGQVFDTYWIVELENKMYIIDQHAAHEKVIYERLRKQIDNNEVYSQSISPAIIVTFTPAEIEIFEKYQDNFRSLGFEVDHFGGKDYAISAVPSELFRLNAKDYFYAILDDLGDNSKLSDVLAINDRIATMACKAAIKGNMHFSLAEGKALIDELLTLDNPYNCPHGRPTIISYSQSEIEKLFKRIV